MSWRFHLVEVAAAVAMIQSDAMMELRLSEAQHRLVEGARPIAVVGAREPHSDRWRVISFYALPAPDETAVAGRSARRYLAVRLAGDHDGVTGGARTDEAACPQIRGAVTWIATLPMPVPYAPAITPEASERFGGRPANVPTDPATLHFWTSARQLDNSLATVRAEVYGGPIGQWFDSVERNLEPCWSASTSPPAEGGV